MNGEGRMRTGPTHATKYWIARPVVTTICSDTFFFPLNIPGNRFLSPQQISDNSRQLRGVGGLSTITPLS